MTDAFYADGFSTAALTFRFVRSRGPGGQHVNTSATGVQLRVDLTQAELPPAVLQRLRKLAGQYLTQEDELVIGADEFRSQRRNREAAIARLDELVAEARKTPRKRIPTRPSRSARQARMDSKKKQGRKKQQRKKPLDF